MTKTRACDAGSCFFLQLFRPKSHIIIYMENGMKTAAKNLIGIISLIAILLTACKADVTRNSDGSYTVETTVSQEELQDAITASIADPLIKDITVSLQSGYVLVSGERARLNDNSKTDTLTFRLDMAA